MYRQLAFYTGATITEATTSSVAGLMMDLMMDEFFPQQLASFKLAYERAVYEVLTTQRVVAIRVNEQSLTLEQLLKARGRKTWALITAYNPNSQLLDGKENKKRAVALIADIEKLGFCYLQAVGRDPAGQWPPEESLFVMDILQGEAISLGKKYSQNALLYGEIGSPAKLIWLVQAHR